MVWWDSLVGWPRGTDLNLLLVLAGKPHADAAVWIDGYGEINRPTADLAVFDVVLLYVGRIDQDIDFLAAVRTLDGTRLKLTHSKRDQVFVVAAPRLCKRVINERRKTLLNRSWQAEDTCSINVELTRRMVTWPSARMEA